MDYNTIQQIIMMTLNQQRLSTRPQRGPGQLPAVYKVNNERSELSFVGMMPPSRVGREKSAGHIYTSRISRESSTHERSKGEAG